MASRSSSVLLLLLAALRLAAADIYMHSPAGSNNRNRERRENRRNANRLFDSQNNDKGGYAWQGDREADGAPDPMTYYEGSILQLQWTVQHGCGSDPTTDCEVNIQYACDDTLPNLRDGYPTGDLTNAGDAGFDLRAFARNDGGNTTPGGEGTDTITEATKDDVEYGMHESFAYYQACQTRQRNKGLFTADQNLNGNDARRTRQNPSGNDAYGFECPEERDYFPYWAPTPWRDAAILVSREEQCSYYQQASRNGREVWHCVLSDQQRADGAEDGLTPITAAGCAAAGGAWAAAASWGTAPPACGLHARSRQNHLGDVVDAGGAEGPVARSAHYDWEIPGDVLDATGQDEALCVVRMRYNVSTTDYGALNGMALRGSLSTALPLTAADNCDQGDAGGCGDGPDDLAGGARPLYNRPYVQALRAGDPELGIALNTNQAGRTFEDRSYVFRISRRPAGVSAAATILNVNTRGKRGNIVQVFPAVEYDFVPQNLAVRTGALLHIQWTGSDYNVARDPNNAEGWRFSDRTNLVEAAAGGHSFPLPETMQTFFGTYEEKKQFALLGQQALADCGTYEDGDANEQNSPDNCGKLNAAPAHFDGGLVEIGAAHAETGEFSFVSTRNNNFSNRGQKWNLRVRTKGDLTTAVVLVAGVAAALVLTAFVSLWLLRAGACCFCKRTDDSSSGGQKKNRKKKKGSSTSRSLVRSENKRRTKKGAATSPASSSSSKSRRADEQAVLSLKDQIDAAMV